MCPRSILTQGCKEENEPTPLLNRIQIYQNSELKEEYFYDDDNMLRQEISYFASYSCTNQKEINEKLVYFYKNNNPLDYIEVYDGTDHLIRVEQYFYDEIGNPNKIRLVLPAVDRYGINLEYGEEILKFKGFDRDTIEILLDTLSADQFIRWYDPGVFIVRYTLDMNQNVDNFIFGDTKVLLTYDEKKNPLSEFGTSQILPSRISPNNVTKIESRFIGLGSAGSVIIRYVADLQYEYDNLGRPLSVIKSYSATCELSDTIKYVYDRVTMP